MSDDEEPTDTKSDTNNDINDTKYFDFELQAAEAKQAEDKLRKALAGAKVELKTERGQWHEKGNIVIEYESHGKPSGLAATKADYWVHELRTHDDETLVYMMFPIPMLNRLCNELMDEGRHNWRPGGEGKKMEMILVNLSTLFDRLKEFSGKGDEKFFDRKERKQGLRNAQNEK